MLNNRDYIPPQMTSVHITQDIIGVLMKKGFQLAMHTVRANSNIFI